MKIKNFILLALCLSYVGNFFAAAAAQYEFSKNGFLNAIEILNEPLVAQFLNNPQMTLGLLNSGLRLAIKHQKLLNSKSEDHDLVITDLIDKDEYIDKQQMENAKKLGEEMIKLRKIIKLLNNKIKTMVEPQLQQLADQDKGCDGCLSDDSSCVIA